MTLVKDAAKTKAQLLEELAALRAQVAELEGPGTDRKRTRKAFRVRDAAMEASLAAIAITDLNGLLTYANAAFLRLWGYDDAAEVLARPLADFLHVRPKTKPILKAVRDEGTWTGELVARRKDGSLFHVELAASIVADEAGSAAAVVCCFSDITQRQRAEKALLESEQRLRLIVENASDGINIAELDLATGKRRVIFCNDRYVEMSGYTRQQLMQSADLAEFQVETRRRGIDEDPYDRFLRGLSCKGTGYWKRPDGTETWFEWTGVPVKAGDKIQIIGIDRDVTERRHIENALRFSKRFLEIANRHTETTPLLDEFMDAFQEVSHCEAIGLRLANKEGDITYKACRGFPRALQASEGPLSLNADSCMCVSVVKGDADSSTPFRTDGGSFLINGTTRYLAGVADEQRASTCDVCNRFGYESVALVPIRVGGRCIGLIHVADRRENMFPLRLVRLLEDAATHLGSALERLQAREQLRKLAKELERRVAERTAELARSEERFRTIVEYASDGISFCELDPVTLKKRLVFCNDRYVEMSGFTRRELMSTDDVCKFLVGGSIAEERDAVHTSLIQGVPLAGTDSWRRPDGRENVFEWRAVPINVGGKVQIVGIDRDITERRRAEEALRESERRLRSIFENANDGISFCEVDPERETKRLLLFNDRYVEMSGRTREELAGADDLSGWNTPVDEDPEEGKRKWQDLLNGLPARGIASWNRPDGKQNFYEWAAVAARKGDKYEFVSIERDITERRRAEETLKRREKYLACLTEISAQLLAATDLDSVLPVVLARLREVSGADRCFFLENRVDPSGEVFARLRFQDCAPGQQPVLDNLELQDFATGKLLPTSWVEFLSAGKPAVGPNERFPAVERRFLESAGIRWIAALPLRVRDRFYGIFGFAASRPGVTWSHEEVALLRIAADTINAAIERLKGEEMLRATSRMEMAATLAGGVAHDVNNLMVGVLGNAELLKAQLDPTPSTLKMLGDVCWSAQKAGELAQQLLAFARGGRYQPKLVNLNDTVQETVRHQSRFLPPAIETEQRIDPALWRIEADPCQMTQVVMNLFRNAAEAIEGAGRIIISTNNMVADEDFARAHTGIAPGRHVCLSVVDTGCGINAATLSRVFEPFFTTKEAGRGLGLAAVYGIVKNHGGHISITSEAGGGTTAAVYLPAAEVPIAPPAEPEEPMPTGAETILVIDDEQIVLNVTQEMLKRLGYSVIIARDAAAAIHAARTFEGDIHLALLDMSMPLMSGAEAYSHLVEARPDMKVIICSGYELDDAAKAVLKAGAHAFIQKPFTAAGLAREVREVLDS